MNQSPNDSIKIVGVVGAGTMGHGIVQVLVGHGYSLLLNDLSAKLLDAAALWGKSLASRSTSRCDKPDAAELRVVS